MEKQGPAMEIVHLLRAVVVDLGLLNAEFAARNGMHPTDVRALICLMDALRADTPLTAGLLGTRLGLNSAGTTAVIDRLERLGHVHRVRDGHDRRRVHIELDERAIALGTAFFGPLIDRTVDLLTGYDERELAAVRGFLEGVRTAAG
ncbi:MarR family winged helix-turn-helix transcriptional regulator [Streptomyces sp. NPDC058001]|uniref:MarR family winged helix-turn-helix transcriptional regulator n=1 Tax=Streptomyces sp. NPDC058001 TaxID=3346300 RepID=UPI0036E5D93C